MGYFRRGCVIGGPPPKWDLPVTSSASLNDGSTPTTSTSSDPFRDDVVVSDDCAVNTPTDWDNDENDFHAGSSATRVHSTDAGVAAGDILRGRDQDLAVPDVGVYDTPDSRSDSSWEDWTNGGMMKIRPPPTIFRSPGSKYLANRSGFFGGGHNDLTVAATFIDPAGVQAAWDNPQPTATGWGQQTSNNSGDNWARNDAGNSTQHPVDGDYVTNSGGGSVSGWWGPSYASGGKKSCLKNTPSESAASGGQWHNLHAHEDERRTRAPKSEPRSPPSPCPDGPSVTASTKAINDQRSVAESTGSYWDTVPGFEKPTTTAEHGKKSAKSESVDRGFWGWDHSQNPNNTAAKDCFAYQASSSARPTIPGAWSPDYHGGHRSASNPPSVKHSKATDPEYKTPANQTWGYSFEGTTATSTASGQQNYASNQQDGTQASDQQNQGSRPPSLETWWPHNPRHGPDMFDPKSSEDRGSPAPKPKRQTSQASADSTARVSSREKFEAFVWGHTSQKGEKVSADDQIRELKIKMQQMEAKMAAQKTEIEELKEKNERLAAEKKGLEIDSKHWQENSVKWWQQKEWWAAEADKLTKWMDEREKKESSPVVANHD